MTFPGTLGSRNRVLCVVTGSDKRGDRYPSQEQENLEIAVMEQADLPETRYSNHP